MRSLIKTALVALALSAPLAAPAGAGQLEDGLIAYDAEYYAGAYTLLQPLAEQGNPLAQARMGAMFAFGLGVPPNDTAAADWFRKAAEQGDATGQYGLGISYFGGHGVDQDDAEAAHWLRLAADQGEALALFGMGYLYSEGRGVPQDDVEAYRWFEIASVAGHPEGSAARDEISARMTDAQVFQADTLALEWWFRKK